LAMAMASRHSFGVEPQASAREVPGAPRRAFGLGALSGFAACAGLAALLLFRDGVLAPRQGTNFAGAPAVPKPAPAGLLPRRQPPPSGEADAFDAFDHALDNLGRPVLAIVNGDTVAGNAGLIDSLLGKVDKMIIGGGMAAAFLEASNGTAAGVGASHEKEGAASALGLTSRARERGVELILPVDFAPPQKPGEDGGSPGMWSGPRSAELRKAAVRAAETMVWNCAAELDPLQQDAAFCGDCRAGREGRRRLSGMPAAPVDEPGEWVARDEFRGKKSFAFFRCKNCKKTWMSAHGYKQFKQGCKRCDEDYLPLFMWKNHNKRRSVEDMESERLDGPHDSSRCEACRRGVCTAKTGNRW